jgi:hypothetical protein
MLNENLSYELLMEETLKRSYLLENVERDDEWKGGPLVIPFKGNSGTSYSYGALTDEDEVHEYDYVRGEISTYKEIWGAIRFNAKDITQHDAIAGQASSVINEQSFLKILPDQVEEFVDGMKDVVSVNLLIGAHFASLSSDATANDGVIEVDRPERFELGQKVHLQSDTVTNIPKPLGSPANNTTGFVTQININKNQITLRDARQGGNLLDFSVTNFTTAANAKTYFQGAPVAGKAFTSLREQLLAPDNVVGSSPWNGSANLFGQSKLAYPYLQAINVDGQSVSATNILDKIFDAWTRIQQLGKGHATDAVMSYKNLGSVMKLLEAGAGAYRHVSTEVSAYGYTKIVVVGVKGSLTIIGVHEMDDDVIFFLDWRSLKLHSDGFFRKQVDPEGKAYYTIRATTGYVYLCDIAFYGELVLHRPSHCGVLWGISY